MAIAATRLPERDVARRDLLRLATAGSVDDGKSTLIGRLLFETREVFEDHLASVERTSRDQGADYVNLALLTDGLRAEREQGITIDVAYRHFGTPRRRFILADTPGHVQYTRNMVTGTSTADLTLLLLDARRGLTEQTRRHLFVAALLDVPAVVVCVNKLDLVGYSEQVFRALQAELEPLVRRLGLRELVAIPVSALRGDNVVHPSANTPWYHGPTLLAHLEDVDVTTAPARAGTRLPVQMVIRPYRHAYHDYRSYAGPLVSGTLAVADRVAVLPSGQTSRVASIETFDGQLARAVAPQSVAVRLEDDLDVVRGDLLADPDDAPLVGQDIEATLCWFSPAPLRLDGRYVVKHTTRSTPARVGELRSRVDVNTASEEEPGAGGLTLNEIGRVRVRTMAPLAYDAYRRNRATGSLIVIDEVTNETVAAGVITG